MTKTTPKDLQLEKQPTNNWQKNSQMFIGLSFSMTHSISTSGSLARISSSRDTCKISASFTVCSKSGVASAFSHLEIACLEIKRSLASSSWDKWRSWRNFFSCVENVVIKETSCFSSFRITGDDLF